MGSVGQWLEGLELGQYTEVFERNAVDVGLLRDLTETDLERLGVEALGHRKRLLKAIAELGASQAATQSQPGRPVRLEAERRQLTVMFCDLVGSTELATKLDPEQLRDLMQVYQHACGEVVSRYDGHIAQYLGDGLMVYFGWPRAHEDDAVRAIRAGLEVVDAVSKLNSATPIRARVGIHTGLVVVGETGQGDASIPKAAVGETPNIAARLQALAEPSSVVVSERTCSLARGLFDYADLGAHALKGMSEPMRLVKVVGPRTTESRFDAARGGVALTPLVGREEEVPLLLRRWDKVRKGEGQVVLLSGEPGIGKSRLTQVLREHIEGQAHTALRYQCSPYHLNSALYPIIEQFEFASGFAREDTPEQRLDKMEATLVGSQEQRAESAPLFAALLSLPTDRYPPLKVSPQKQKEKTLEALAGQVEALAREAPVLMVFEDVHWIDPTSQESLDVLLPRLHALPVLLVLTYRPEHTPAWVGQSNVTSLTLNRLGAREGAELVAKVTGGRTLPQEVLDQVLAHTDGVPLFIEELTKSVLESKLLREAGDAYVLQGALPALAIPTTLRDSLIARLDRLAPVREIAQIGACIGREFSYELLAALSPIKGEPLEEALEQLTRTGLLFRRGAFPNATYTFKHALVQDTAYDSLLKSKRQQLHAQIAKIIEEKYGAKAENEPELLAHHYTGAGMLEPAIRWWRKASEVALARYALVESIAHGDKGMALIAQMPPSTLRDNLELDLRVSLGTAWMRLGGWGAPPVGQNLEPAWELAQALRRDEHTLRILFGIWTHRINIGQVQDSLRWAERLSAEGEKRQDTSMWTAGNWALALAEYSHGNFVGSLDHAERILTRYEIERFGPIPELLNADGKVNALSCKAIALWCLGFPDRAHQASVESVDWARHLGNPSMICFAHLQAAWTSQLRRDPDEMNLHTEAMKQLAQEVGLIFYAQVYAPIQTGLAMVLKAEPAAAIAQLRLALPAFRSAGFEIFVPLVRGALAQTLGTVGMIDEAVEEVWQALAQINRKGWGEHLHHSIILVTKGSLLLLRNDFAGAEVSYREALDIARQQQAKGWELSAAMSLARLWQNQGKRAAALELLAPIYNWFTEGFDTKDLKEAKALLEELS